MARLRVTICLPPEAVADVEEAYRATLPADAVLVRLRCHA